MEIGTSFLGEGHYLQNTTGVGVLTSVFLFNAIIIAGVILLFLIIIAGYNMIAGAGNENPKQFARGKEIITAGVIGFVLIIVAYWIYLVVLKSTGLEVLPAE